MNIEFLFVSFLVPIILASDNGKYYICDTTILNSDNKCIFALSGDQPAEWIQETVEHEISRSVGADFYRKIQSYDGETVLSVSPKPWVNGDSLVESTEPITGDQWSGYTLIFEMMAPLRDMMMYNPTALTEDVWAKYTRALTDCNSKTQDYDRGSGSPYSTSQVYEYIKNPNGKDIHHYILQYLEEGSIDLVCLSTDLDMEHCDTMRATAGATVGVDRCNCWFDAYKALYGVCPTIDMTFTTCSGTTAPVDCANVVPQDTSGLSGSDNPPDVPNPPEDMPSPPNPPAKG